MEAEEPASDTARCTYDLANGHGDDAYRACSDQRFRARETGADMSRFPSAPHLASWVGMCPGNNEFAGKHGPGKTRTGSKWLRVMLIESAEAAARSKPNYLRSQYARLKGRRGHKKAIVAVAHSILVIGCHLLSRRQPYAELGPDYLLLRERTEAYTNRLVRQLERLGHKVTIEPLPVSV